MHQFTGQPRDFADVDVVRRKLLKLGVYVAPAILGTVIMTENAYASGDPGDQGGNGKHGNGKHGG